jgi:hypothetical protein
MKMKIQTNKVKATIRQMANKDPIAVFIGIPCLIIQLLMLVTAVILTTSENDYIVAMSLLLLRIGMILLGVLGIIAFGIVLLGLYYIFKDE